MDKFDRFFEEVKVQANELADKIRELIHEGNVRRIIIKDEHGHTFMEIPLTVATVGIVLAPILAAVGAIATLVAKFHIVVERATPHADPAPSATTDSSVGATESQMRMDATVPQRVDNKGTHLEDEAGTGGHDSMGG